MAEIIKTTRERIEVTPKNGKYFTLEEMQAVVGGYIEIVYLKDKLMIVNEEGRLNRLPLNYLATKMYGKDFIVGDVLVCDINQVR